MRIIARLDIKNNFVIKGVNLEGLRKIGNPIDIALKYYSEGIDELIFIDAVASLYKRNNLYDIIDQAAKNIFVPLTILVVSLGADNELTAIAASVYFFARAVHYFMHTLAVPLMRTLMFLVGFACQVVMALSILNAI